MINDNRFFIIGQIPDEFFVFPDSLYDNVILFHHQTAHPAGQSRSEIRSPH